MGFITTQGENQIAAKQGAGQPLNITSFVLANIDGLGPEPANRIASLPSPADTMDTLAVTKSGYVNTNQVVYSLVMDSSIGDYDFNWIGLVDDEGVLIAVTHTPLIQKRATDGGVPGNNLTRNFLIAYSGIQATTAIAVPAETWQIDFNARLHGIDERERLSNFDIYGDAAFIDAGWQVVRDGATTTYNILPGIGYVGGIRITSSETQDVSAPDTPTSIWLDVSLQGDISDVAPVVDFVVSATAQANYTDPNGFNHYLTKICAIASGGAVTDLRDANPIRNLIYEHDMPLRGTMVFDDAGSYSWTVPEGVGKAHIIVIGAGGSGGARDQNTHGGGGGGGGGYAESIQQLTEGETIEIIVGSGGAPVVGAAVNGNPGQSSSFGQLISATGGGGGPSGYSSANSGEGFGGNIFNGGLGAGHRGLSYGTTTQSYAGGAGGHGGGRGGGMSSQDGLLPGAGGGGSTSLISGRGADGAVIIKW